jgi:hypothetical protein
VRRLIASTKSTGDAADGVFKTAAAT